MNELVEGVVYLIFVEVLVGIVECCDISKFSDANTNARHVQACRKKAQKVPNFRAKKRTSKHAFFFFFVHYTLPVPKNLKMNKKWKVMIFFSSGHRVVCPKSTCKILQKVGAVTKNANVGGIWRHRADITTCPRYVNDISN